MIWEREEPIQEKIQNNRYKFDNERRDGFVRRPCSFAFMLTLYTTYL